MIDFGNLVYIFMVFSCMSFALLRESKFSRIGETTMVSCTIGNFVVMSYLGLRGIVLRYISKGNYLIIFPLLIGTLVFIRLSGSLMKKYKAISMWGTNLLIGVGMGLTIRGVIETEIVNQLSSLILPLYGVSLTEAIQNIFVVASALLVIFYFLFTFYLKEEKGIIGSTRQLGRYCIIVVIGVLYGRTIMTRVSYLIGTFGDIIGMFK